jgi:hypothetical protein
MSPPVLAVVGFVNMGKSSLVATLTETDSVAIAPTGGTTTRCQHFACVAEGETVLELVDTPGFQSARRALRWLEDWLEERGEESATGPDAVRAFLEANRGSEVFVNECELLAPLMAGAGVLYLVDAALPYKAKYEAEMRILAMTGRPRMGVINLHGEAEHRQAWHDALSANFAKVVAIDVIAAPPAERRAVLRAFAGIDDDWAPAFQRAARLLEDEDRVRRRRVASELRELIVFCLSHEVRVPWDEDQDRARRESELRKRLKADLAAAEQRSRRTIEGLLGFRQLQREEGALAVVDDDLFSREVWRMLGMSRRSLITASTASGAGMGALIDLGVGGLSMGTGALIGAGVGLISGLAAIQRSFKVKVLGQDLLGQGSQLAMHAPTHLKWASIVLDRALIHYRLLRLRAHARRDPLRIDGASVVDRLDKDAQKELASLVAATARSDQDLDEDLRRRWHDWLLAAIEAAEPRTASLES